MKHEREWYTCDRCGKEIEENLRAWTMFPDHIFRPRETINFISSEPYGYVCEQSHELKNINAVSIIRGYHKKEKLIHLCGRCSKEFDKFIQNKI